VSSPLVSVVLPTHNREELLRIAVQSVLSQTVDDLELIVVDDGSTDDTQALLQTFGDPRLVCVHLEDSHGAAAARNAGIRRSAGSFIAFQDSDDEWLPSKLADQLAVFEQHAEVGGVGGRYSIDAGVLSSHISAPCLELGLDYESELLEGSCCVTPVWMIRRCLLDDIGLFDERMPCLEDWDLLLRLSKRTAMRAAPTEVLIKRGAADSLGGDIRLRAEGLEHLLDRHGARFRAYPRRYASFCLEAAYLALILGDMQRVRRFTLGAFRHGRPSRSVLIAFLRACVAVRRHGRHVWPVPGLVGAS